MAGEKKNVGEKGGNKINRDVTHEKNDQEILEGLYHDK